MSMTAAPEHRFKSAIRRGIGCVRRAVRRDGSAVFQDPQLSRNDQEDDHGKESEIEDQEGEKGQKGRAGQEEEKESCREEERSA
jgi:hypothetical protein